MTCQLASAAQQREFYATGGHGIYNGEHYGTSTLGAPGAQQPVGWVERRSGREEGRRNRCSVAQSTRLRADRREQVRHLYIPAKGVCQLNLARCAALRFKDLWRTHQN